MGREDTRMLTTEQIHSWIPGFGLVEVLTLPVLEGRSCAEAHITFLSLSWAEQRKECILQIKLILEVLKLGQLDFLFIRAEKTGIHP